jgi:hypothetical protein
MPLAPVLVFGVFFTTVHRGLAWYAILLEGIAESALIFIALAALNACSTGLIAKDSRTGSGPL